VSRYDRQPRMHAAPQHAKGIVAGCFGYTCVSSKEFVMPSIAIKRRHKLDPKKARAVAQRIARDLNKRYGLICQWDGDNVAFDGVGVSGSMQVGKTQIKLDVQLSFLLTPLKGTIEREINKELDTLLPNA
jgi:putative polyhydroxyalkanoate system protein